MKRIYRFLLFFLISFIFSCQQIADIGYGKAVDEANDNLVRDLLLYIECNPEQSDVPPEKQPICLALTLYYQ